MYNILTKLVYVKAFVITKSTLLKLELTGPVRALSKTCYNIECELGLIPTSYYKI